MEHVQIRVADGQTFDFKGTQSEVTRGIREIRKTLGKDFEITNIDVIPPNR